MGERSFDQTLLGTLEYGTENDTRIAEVAAAPAYRNRHDTDTMRIEAMRKTEEPIAAIARITGLSTEGDERSLLERVSDAYQILALQPEVERYMRQRTRIVFIAEAEKQIRFLIE